jgi:uncharacterized protein (TIGR02145 family)
MKKPFSATSEISAIVLGIFISLLGCHEDDIQDDRPKTGPIIFNPSTTYGNMTDQDSNTYKTVIIGTQTWMAENLRTTKYNDGTSIPIVIDNKEWEYLSTPGYCWCNNDPATFKNIYGALYNWFSVNTGKLAPTGWHVPTDEEWTILTNFLGGEAIAGGKMKEQGTSHWWSPNTGATNVSGFTTLPCGYRSHFNGDFPYLSTNAYFWSSSQLNEADACYRILFFDGENVCRRYLNCKSDGFSVRCLKD